MKRIYISWETEGVTTTGVHKKFSGYFCSQPKCSLEAHTVHNIEHTNAASTLKLGVQTQQWLICCKSVNTTYSEENGPRLE